MTRFQYAAVRAHWFNFNTLIEPVTEQFLVQRIKSGWHARQMRSCIAWQLQFPTAQAARYRTRIFGRTAQQLVPYVWPTRRKDNR